MSENQDIIISIVMVDGSFRERFHAVECLGKQSFPKHKYELIWVEYFDTANKILAEKITRYPNCRIISLGKKGKYHSSFCYNAGITASRGEILFIMDADVVVTPDFLELAYRDHLENDRIATYYFRYDEPKPGFQKKHYANLESPRFENLVQQLERVCVLQNPENYGGCLSVGKKWLMEINGYEQHPIFGSGFHANGKDVYTRLKNLGTPVRWHPDLKLFHPWHPATLSNHLNYRNQHKVISFRAANLITLPFQGIDETKNSELPRSLQEQLDRTGSKLNWAKNLMQYSSKIGDIFS